MNTRLYIYSYALVIQVFILFYTLWATSKRTTTMWLFVNSACWITAMLFFEGMSWVIRAYSTEMAVHLSYIVNTILYSINALPMISMFLYFDYRVITNSKVLKYRRVAYVCFVGVLLALNISNNWTGILYRISSTNEYSRGPGMYFTVIASLSVLLIYGISMIKYMKSIEGRLLTVMLSFTILPVAGAIIQVFNYGVPAMWTMFTLLSLFIFIFIEREDIMRDTLTNLVTRGQFEQRLKRKLKRDKPFTLLMIDMDKFKMINDHYGHDEGDKVLIVVASILEHSIRHVDMASRYGGDEFMLLLEDTDKGADKYVINRIHDSLDQYNAKKIKPYSIRLSIGSFFIEEPQKAHYLDVLATVDEKMYSVKKLRQSL